MDNYDKINDLLSAISDNKNRSMTLFNNSIKSIQKIIDNLNLSNENLEKYKHWCENQLPIYRERYQTNTSIPFETSNIEQDLLDIIK